MKLDAWSNVAYLLAAIWFAVSGAYVPAAGLAILAWGSFMGHQYGGKWWIADWAAMFIAFGSIIFHNLEIPWLFPILVGAFGFIKPKYYVEEYLFIGLAWMLAYLTAALIGVPAIPVVAVFATALAIRQWGHERMFQTTHSIWHFLTALGFVMLTLTA
jgi:hypothetical protein